MASNGAILMSENRGQDGLSVEALGLSTIQQGIRAVASGALPNRGFSQVGLRFTRILIVCTVQYMPVGGLCDMGCGLAAASPQDGRRDQADPQTGRQCSSRNVP